MAKPLNATKHFHLAKALRNELVRMRPGESVFTVQQIKSRFGVSQSTVTRALQRLQREGLIHRPAGRSRYIISEVGPKALHHVTIIRPTWPSPDYDALVRNVILHGEQRGWAFQVYANQNDLEDLDLTRAIGDSDGALLLPSSDRFPEHLSKSLVNPSKPVVISHELPLGLKVSGALADDYQAGRMAVEHLAELGHRKILCVNNEPNVRSIHERTRGYREAMDAIGQHDYEHMIVRCQAKPSEQSMAVAYEKFRQWLVGPRPKFTAMFCTAWTGAMAVMRAMREEGGWRAPHDYSMVAFAGEAMLMPYLDPPLTAVGVDASEIAKAALDLLEEQFSSAISEPGVRFIKPHLIERESCHVLDSTTNPKEI